MYIFFKLLLIVKQVNEFWDKKYRDLECKVISIIKLYFFFLKEKGVYCCTLVCLSVCPSVCLFVTKISDAIFSATILRKCLNFFTQYLFRHVMRWDIFLYHPDINFLLKSTLFIFSLNVQINFRRRFFEHMSIFC